MTYALQPTPQVTVVIPTRDRPLELRRTVAAIAELPTAPSYEVIVVDDGSRPPLSAEGLRAIGPDLTLIRCDGEGPARARNAGIAAARGWLVLFTDDDTIPRQGWIDAAYEFLQAHPGYIGVEGPTVSPPFDPLYFHSIDSTARGAFLTCNIGYRRSALVEVGGFAELFPFPHAEDLDLGVRMTKLGPLGYCDAMAVLHPPRAVRLADLVRKGRVLASDATLYSRHPDHYPATRYLSGTGYALVLNAKRWVHSAYRDAYGIGMNPWRALRYIALATGYTYHGVSAMVTGTVRPGDPSASPLSSPHAR